MVGARVSHPFGGPRPGAGQGQIAGFLFSPGVRHQQVGEPLPHMAEHPVGPGAAELGVSPAEAFRLLSCYSQNTNQRVRKIAAGLVQGRITAAELRSPSGPGQA